MAVVGSDARRRHSPQLTPCHGSCVVLTDATAQLEHGTEETAASAPSVYLQQLNRRILLRSRGSSESSSLLLLRMWRP